MPSAQPPLSTPTQPSTPSQATGLPHSVWVLLQQLRQSRQSSRDLSTGQPDLGDPSLTPSSRGILGHFKLTIKTYPRRPLTAQFPESFLCSCSLNNPTYQWGSKWSGVDGAGL